MSNLASMPTPAAAAGRSMPDPVVQWWMDSLRHPGKSFPVLVMVSLPCLTPLAAINSSASFLMAAALPRTASTSRQLSWSR